LTGERKKAGGRGQGEKEEYRSYRSYRIMNFSTTAFFDF
jgi:hypothetical protein